MKYNNYWLSFLLVVGVVVRFAHAQPARASCVEDSDCPTLLEPCMTNECRGHKCMEKKVKKGTECGAAVGECDLPDTCDSHGVCVDGGKKEDCTQSLTTTSFGGFDQLDQTPAPTQCTSDADCDDSNPCKTYACTDGSCVDTNVDEGTTCGFAPQNECDLQDTCDGNGACVDRKLGEGDSCGEQPVGPCDPTYSCTATSECLPTFPAEETICLDAVGDCDMPDVCDGNGNCLAKFAAEGTTCADAGAVGDCELPDVCDGSGNCLVKFAAEGTTCGFAQDGLCDAQDTCDGNGACVDRKASDGTECGLEDGCLEANKCQEGLCICPIPAAATDDKPAADDKPTGSSGGSYGDPHLKTWKGTVYDFHGACDLVLVKDSAFSAGAGLELHIRTTIRRDWSFVSAAALRISDDVLEVRSGAEYYLNGVKSAKLPSSIGGYPITVKAHGQKRHRFKVNLHNNREILIKVYNEFLAVSVNNADDDFATSVGMMGSYETGELIARDGKTVVDDTNLFGFEWQVQQDDPILFLEPSGPQYPQPCDMPTDKAPKRRLSEDAMVSLEDAEKACESWPLEGRESCVYDVLATGDLEMAQAGAF